VKRGDLYCTISKYYLGMKHREMLISNQSINQPSTRVLPSVQILIRDDRDFK
jgi:hypothetical protein